MSITKFRNSLSRYLRPLVFAMVLAFAVGIALMYGGGSNYDNQDRERRTHIGTVNGEKIPVTLYADAINNWRNSMKTMSNREPSPSETASQKARLLEELVMLTLRENDARERGIKVSKKDLNAEIDRIVEQRIEAVREQALNLGNEKDKDKNKKLSQREQDQKLEELLRVAYGNPKLTLDSHKRDIRKELKTKEAQIRTSLMIQRLDEQIRRGIRMSDKELVDSYRTIRARHIQVNTASRQEGQAKRKADEILTKLREGGDFAGLAKEHSDDTMTKNDGGAWPMDIMNMYAYGIDPAVVKVLFALKPGQISDVIKTENGYEIVKVDSEQRTLPPDFDKKKKEYMAEKLQAKQDQAVNEHYYELRKSAKVEISEPDLRGYWLLSQVGTAMEKDGDEGRKKTLAQAAKAFEAALQENGDDASTVYVLAQTYRNLNRNDEAIRILEEGLEIRTNIVVEGPDLRILLGDLYVTKEENDRAVQQYQKASDVGYPDYMVHQQLVYSFKQIGREDLADKEQKMAEEMAPQQDMAEPAAATEVSP